MLLVFISGYLLGWVLKLVKLVVFNLSIFLYEFFFVE